MKSFQNILVVRTDRIGDVILTTPAIRALRKAYPQAWLAVLVASSNKDLVEGNPDIDQVIVDDKMGRHWGFLGFLKLIRTLRRQRFDIAFNFIPKKRTNLLCALAGIPNRVGYHNNKFGFLLTVKIPDKRHLGTRHEAEYCLDVLRFMDIPAELDLINIPSQREAEDWADDFIKVSKIDITRRIVAIHPDASCPTKRWPISKFIKLIEQICEKYNGQIILVGSSKNRKDANQILRAVRGDILDLTGQTDVGQLVSLLRRCHILISNDSGPVHIAVGVGTPVVSIFTRNQPGINPERWGPLDKRSRVVLTPFKGEMSFAKGRIPEPGYLELIPIRDVLEAVDALFKLC